MAALLEAAAAHIRAGRSSEALAAADAVESIEPDNPWPWYFRGIVHTRRGEPYRAMAAFDRAADLLDPVDPAAAALDEQIRRRRRDARRQTVGLSLQTGLAYDTNVTFLGSGASSLGQISGAPDAKYLQQLRLDYAPIADATQALAFSTRLGHSWHFDIEEFNYQNYGMTVQYVRRVTQQIEAGIRYDYDVSLLGNEPFGFNHALTPSLAYRWSPTGAAVRPATTRVSYLFEARDFLFETDPLLDQDGFANGVGFEQSFLLPSLEPQRLAPPELALGYRFLRVPTQGREFDRYEHQWYLALVAPLRNPLLPDKDCTFRFQADWLLADYRFPSLFDVAGRPRRDLIPTLTFALSQKLIEDIDLGDLTLHAIITWSDADSNVLTEDFGTPFSYDRSVFGLQLEWNW